MTEHAPDLTTAELRLIADALDRAESLHGDLSADVRARVFAAIESPSRDTWLAARSVVVRRSSFASLWKIVADYTGDASAEFTPTGRQIIDALAAYPGREAVR